MIKYIEKLPSDSEELRRIKINIEEKNIQKTKKEKE
jgi:hypothetical protein